MKRRGDGRYAYRGHQTANAAFVGEREASAAVDASKDKR
jgi:hypothetical protein